MADSPLLALPGGSILQFLLMTLPLLGVYLYFLYLAIERPSIANPNDERYMEDRIKLMDILYTYLATLVPFAALMVYLLWFVRKRRTLSRKYETDAITILGNVEYDESYYAAGEDRNALQNVIGWAMNGFTLRQNYGRIVYDLERVANHPACNYEERRGKNLSGTIKKKVRVYYRYPREQVSILVIPNYPYSGQPKIDMEADWAAFAKDTGLPSEDQAALADTLAGPVETPQVLSRDRSIGVLVVAAFWICFLLGASLFLCFQIDRIDEFYEDEDGEAAWTVFYCMVGGVVPLVALGGNFIRWKIYEHWMLKRGRKSRKGSRRDDVEPEASEQGSYVQMT